MEDDGTGYFQTKFLAVCSNCSKTFTKEQLRARKVAENLASLIPPPWVSVSPRQSHDLIFNRGTVLTNSPAADKKAERAIQANLNKTVNPANAQKILEKAGYSLAKLRLQAGKNFTMYACSWFSKKRFSMITKADSGDKITIFMTAHLEPMIYSVELAGAVGFSQSTVQTLAKLDLLRLCAKAALWTKWTTLLGRALASSTALKMKSLCSMLLLGTMRKF
jgi:hypothetical protein